MNDRLPEHSIFTYTGRRFWPLQPEVEEVDILDIAHALSNSCRFTGHVKTFYSVAQHSVLVSNLVPVRYALTGLLHDASEAYLSDIASPVKQQMPFYKVAEAKLLTVIAGAFDLAFPFPQVVKKVDKRMLMTEKRDLLIGSGEFSPIHTEGAGPYDFKITPLLPAAAKAEFLARFHELTGLPVRVQENSCEDGSCGLPPLARTGWLAEMDALIRIGTKIASEK